MFVLSFIILIESIVNKTETETEISSYHSLLGIKSPVLLIIVVVPEFTFVVHFRGVAKEETTGSFSILL